MSNLTELVRVKDPTTGAEYSTSRAHAENSELKILEDKDAIDQWGRVLPAKTRPAALARLTGESTVPEIEAAAAEAGVDLSGAKNKAEKLAVLEAATPVTPGDVDTTVEA